MTKLLVNTPLIDWLSLTSWDITAWDLLISDTDYTTKTIDGYKGHRDNLTGIWAGTGKQQNFSLGEVVAHRMMQVSGYRAAAAYDILRANPIEDETCTRIDIQITTDWPNPDLFGVARRWREKGRHANYLESQSGSTIYLGAWGSDRFVRVYSKTATLTRFEVCYRKAYASPCWLRLGQLTKPEHVQESIRRWLLYELLRIDDPVLSDVFGKVLSGDSEKPPREERRGTTDTERWIKRVVCPALSKYVNSHDIDPYIIMSIMDILRGEKDNDQA